MTQPVQDRDLLGRYVDEQSEEAFAQLVSAHIDMVYSACLRQLGDPHWAQDVTQVVFVILTRKAAAIRGRTGRVSAGLSGWLIQTARYACLNARKSEVRRRHHEQRAGQMMQNIYQADTSWQRLSPLLDEGLSHLSPKERSAIATRYLEEKSVAETGRVLGISADAAEMRILRGLSKLRSFFARRGVAMPLVALAGVIAVNAIGKAPPALAGSMTMSAPATPQTAELINRVLFAMKLAKAKSAAAIAALSLLIAAILLMVILALVRPQTHAPDRFSCPFRPPCSPAPLALLL